MSDADRFRLPGALSPAQRAVLLLGLLAGAVMGGCPPWLEVRTQIPASNNENLRPVSTAQASVYAPVFRPPQPWLDEPHPDLMDERVTYRQA
jgi:hypothetical protein